MREEKRRGVKAGREYMEGRGEENGERKDKGEEGKSKRRQ